MSRDEILSEINDTIDTIKSYCNHVDDILDACYVKNNIETWLDTLREEIDKYDDANE